MFPNNKEIGNLIDEYNELIINDKSDIEKKRIQSTKNKTKFNINNYNYDNNNLNKNISKTNLNENKNIKIIKQNIYEKYNIIPLPNKRFIKDLYENNNKSYSNIKNDSYNILFQNNNNNEELINEQNNKINNYKNTMNKELLEILRNEKQKDELRQRELEQLDYNDPQRIILEKKFREVFKSYLKDIWNDLSQRKLENDITGISKITFSSYYNLPGIILDRLFNVFDSTNSGVLKLSDFTKGMITLFCEDFEICCPFIFNFYDFDKDGKISKEDIRTVLSYVSLSQEIQNYKSRVHSQKELSDILEKCFSKIKGDKMDYTNFKNIIENEASDIYIMILLFLYEKKPFTKKTLTAYLKITKDSPIASPIDKSPSKLFVSPSKGLSFSPYKVITRNSKRTVTLKENISNAKMRE